jgi:uncharacterized protein DUF4154
VRTAGRALRTAVALAALASCLASADDADPPTEHQVKAAFLLHFARLVDWPNWPKTDDASEPFEIAVVGRDPFGADLEATIGASPVQGRPIRIRRAPSAEALERPPQILFVAEQDPAEARRALKALRGQPVLTVGETSGFAERGGLIGFRLTDDGRVAFDVNLQLAERAGLKLSSQLLRVARVVESKP